MKITSMIPTGIGVLLLVSATMSVHGQESQKKPAIDPNADSVLHQMSDHMKEVKALVFRVSDTIDEVQQDGQKLQFAHVRELTVVRPNKLKVDVIGDVNNRTLWKDGTTITLLDKDKKAYAQIADPGTIDQALTMLQEKYGMSLPASDLLSEDVYKTLTEVSNGIDYVGVGYVGEEKCHHLAFTGDNIDYQLWISMGDKPSPRKMIITYKQQPAQPQYTLQLLKTEDASKIKDDVFTCELPKDAHKIDFHPRTTQR